MAEPTKFGPAAQVIYLESLRKWGQHDLAAEAAGVCSETVRMHRKNNEEFARAEQLALKLRSQDIVRRIETDAIEGLIEPLYNKRGEPIMIQDKETGKMVQAYHRKVETALRVRVLARHDPAYREKSEVNHNHRGGVLLMPKVVGSVSDWANYVQGFRKKAEEPTG